MFSNKDLRQLYLFFTSPPLVDESFVDNDLKQIYNALAHPGTYPKEIFSDGDYEKIYDMIVLLK